MASDRFELPLRIVVEDPFPGVTLALQRGQTATADLVPPTRTSPDATTFDLSVTVEGALKDGRPRLIGPFAQGPADARFIYVNVGTYAGQADSEWGRRVKVHLSTVTWDQVEAAKGGGRLLARFAGRDRKGEPSCASVPLQGGGWSVSPG